MDNRKFPEGQRARQPRITKRSDGPSPPRDPSNPWLDFPSETLKETNHGLHEWHG